MKSFSEFLNEKLDADDMIELYQHFIRILKIHEQHFHKDVKIATDPEFKAELNKIFDGIRNEKIKMGDHLFNLVMDYEKKLYGEESMCGGFGCSLYDFCEAIQEDGPEILTRNRYLQDFSDEDVYLQNAEDYEKETEDIDDEIDGLDKESKFYDLIAYAWDEAVEEFDDDVDKVLMTVINKLQAYKIQYPEYAKKFQEEIEDILEDADNKDDFEY